VYQSPGWTSSPRLIVITVDDYWGHPSPTYSQTMSRELWLHVTICSYVYCTLFCSHRSHYRLLPDNNTFSCLSSAFFHGGDAIFLIIDLNQPETLRALNHWWSEFCACRPLSDEEMEEYCLVVVGNKTDLAPSSMALLSQNGLRWTDFKTNSSRCRAGGPIPIQ
jgi:hypothetical protein